MDTVFFTLNSVRELSPAENDFYVLFSQSFLGWYIADTIVDVWRKVSSLHALDTLRKDLANFL